MQPVRRAYPADGGSGAGSSNAAHGAKAALNAQSTLQRPYTTKAGGKSIDVGLSGNETNAAASRWTAAARYSGRVSGRKRSHDACFRAADGNVSQKAPGGSHSRPAGTASFGGGLSLRYADGGRFAEELCDAEEMRRRWPIIWTAGAECCGASSAAQAVDRSGAELAVVLGAAAVFLPLGLGSGAAHLSVCDVIRDRFRPALGAASE